MEESPSARSSSRGQGENFQPALFCYPLGVLPILFATITAVLDPNPTLSGNCNPTQVHFTGRISSDTAGQVTYSWNRLNHPAGRTFTVNFEKPGTLPVSLDLFIRKSEEGSVALRLVLPKTGESSKVKYKVACK
jgi:hypothetical protein